MISVFVSYRREDSRHQAGRLYDRLLAHFGSGHVFKDVDSIPLGFDFREVLTEHVAGCDVFLAVIGDRWLSIAGKSGARRLDDPGDFVRIEIEAALDRKIPVIPVLVGDSSVPAPEELPESLRKLAFRHGLSVRPDPDFHKDMDRLIRGIEDGVSAVRERSAPRGPRSHESEEQKPAPTPKVPAPVEPAKSITNKIGMKLVLVPSGEFLMGSPDSDKDASDDEKPQHTVRITRPFYLGATEVTVGQFRRFVERAGYQTEAEKDGKGGYGWNEAKAAFEQDPKYTWRNPGFAQRDDHPVVNVSWNDAIAFCANLSALDGLKPFDHVGARGPWDGEGYRLPTEAEWEYSCRAGCKFRYSFGDDSARLGEFGWFNGNSDRKTHPVGQKHPNAFGLYDMHGNVWEWCWDGYKADYYKESPGADPVGPSEAADRVIRGGGWGSNPQLCRSAYRYRFAPEYRNGSLGFRVGRVQFGRDR